MNAKQFFRLLLPILLVLFLPAVTHGTLLIIAPDEFIDELQPLKRFKDASGRPTLLVSLPQIYEQFTGADEPERIKKYIAYHAQFSGVQDVMLVGDVDKFPVRWRWWGRWMPDDPYFTGSWSVVNGQYEQSNFQDAKPFGAWVDIGSYDRYTIDVDVTRLAGEQARILFADADRAACGFRLEILDQEFRVVLCKSTYTTHIPFSINQSYHIQLVLAPTNIQVYVDGFLHEYLPGQYDLVRPGKVGVGTFNGSARFDNFRVTSTTGSVLWDENFDDGIANGFNPSLTAEERGWAVSDLYFADLFKSGTYTFDNWNLDGNGLYGEIEFNLATYCPNCTINDDHIDYLPDVSLGRIPASTAEEVRRYVRKVIFYETATTPGLSWFKNALLYEGSIGGGERNNTIETYLVDPSRGFVVSNRHWGGDLGDLTPQQRKDVVIADLNSGAGLVNYLGHGNHDAWSCMNFNWNDVTSLTNSGKLPIVLAAACFTGKFAPLAGYTESDPYTDKNNNEHLGGSACEPFPGHSAAPNPIQSVHDSECIAERFLFGAGNPPGSGGAIAYLGERSAGRFWANELAEYFFTAYSQGITIGNMWKTMIEDYYWANDIDQSHTWNYGPASWETAHMFDEPQKFVLFGDPSVQVGGAFVTSLCGSVNDGNGGPLTSYSRYRLTCDATIPAGQKLTAQPSASVLFEAGRKITAYDPSATNGFQLNGTSSNPVVLLGLPSNFETADVLRAMIVKGQLRLRQGGAIKFY